MILISNQRQLFLKKYLCLGFNKSVLYLTFWPVITLLEVKPNCTKELKDYKRHTFLQQNCRLFAGEHQQKPLKELKTVNNLFLINKLCQKSN